MLILGFSAGMRIGVRKEDGLPNHCWRLMKFRKKRTRMHPPGEEAVEAMRARNLEGSS
jgi:hypothetical protein